MTSTILDVEKIIKEIDNSDVKSLTKEDLESYRVSLALLKKAVGAKMSETSSKDYIYDEEDIKEYIDNILEDGFNLIETELSDYPEFIDAQRLKRWSDLIAERVEASSFGAKVFRVYSLRLLRSNIAKSKTLHDLRQAVNLMISPLQLWRDHCDLVNRTSRKQKAAEDKDQDMMIDSLILEIEALQRQSTERKRIIDNMLSLYTEADNDVILLRNIEAAKKEHNLSDTDAASLFNVSRKKLRVLRENINLNAI